LLRQAFSIYFSIQFVFFTTRYEPILLTFSELCIEINIHENDQQFAHFLLLIYSN